MATATAEPTTTTAVLKSKLLSDGSWKHTLPAMDLKRMMAVRHMLNAISKVPNLTKKAEAAVLALVEIENELA